LRILSVENSHWFIGLSGVKDVEFSDIDTLLSKVRSISNDTQFQLFNADNISGWQHLYYAAVNAINSFNSSAGISRSLSLETLLYASCQNQISSAFNVLGIKPSNGNIAVLVFGKNEEKLSAVLGTISDLLGTEDDEVLEYSNVKKSLLMNVYGVSETEFQSVQRDDAITWLIIERGALLRR